MQCHYVQQVNEVELTVDKLCVGEDSKDVWCMMIGLAGSDLRPSRDSAVDTSLTSHTGKLLNPSTSVLQLLSFGKVSLMLHCVWLQKR